MRRAPLAAALILLLLGALAPPPVRAQEAPPVTVDSGAELRVLRARGVSTWRNFVWSMRRPRLAHAVAELERAREMAGRTGFTDLYVAAFGHLVLGNAERGRALAAEVRERAPGFGPTRLLDAFEAILAGDGQLALTHLDAYVQIVESSEPDPEFGPEFRFLAYLHRGAQRYEQGLAGPAASDLRTAVRIARESGREPPHELQLRLVRAHQDLNEFGAAERIVLELLQSAPGDATLAHNLGLLAGTQKKLPEARAWYERALARSRSDRASHIKLAFLAWRDAETDPHALVRLRSHVESYASLLPPDARPRARAEAQSGLGSYWLVIARHRIDRGLAADGAYAHALRHFEHALDAEPGCLRALNSIIQIGAELSWPAERLEPYRERLNVILLRQEGAPEAVRSSFC